MMELTQVQNPGEGPRQPPQSDVSHVQRAESDKGATGDSARSLQRQARSRTGSPLLPAAKGWLSEE